MKKTTIYPVTIVCDRYSGMHSGGSWTAWNLRENELPIGLRLDDTDCDLFWAQNEIIVGIGETPDLALLDLIFKIRIAKLG